jgi:hypothetical protein
MADLFKFQKTDKLPALKTTAWKFLKASEKVLIYTKKSGYQTARLTQYFKTHGLHELPNQVDENGIVFASDERENVPVNEVLAWSYIPKKEPEIS